MRLPSPLGKAVHPQSPMGFAGAPKLRGGFWDKILIYQTLNTLTASRCAGGHCKVSEGDEKLPTVPGG